MNINKEIKIEEALRFLYENIFKNKVSDFLILHSLRIAMYLEELGYNSDVVISAILQKAFEKKIVNPNDIREKFGENVLVLIQAVTPNLSIEIQYERDKEVFSRCLEAGKDALIIKSAELLEESKYFHVSRDREKWLYLIGKMKYFNNLSNELIRDEKPWKDVNARYELLKSTFV